MDMEQLAIKLQETTDRSLRNEGRIKKLETEHQALNKLATSVAVLAEKVSTMSGNVEALNGKMDAIEGKAGKRWEDLIDRVIWAVAAAIVSYILARAGI